MFLAKMFGLFTDIVVFSSGWGIGDALIFIGIVAFCVLCLVWAFVYLSKR